MFSRRRCVAVAVLALLAGNLEAGQDAPARARAAFERAAALQANGNDTAALPLFWEAAALAPADADIQNGLGEALARLGVLEAAAAAFKRAVETRPDFRKAANNLVLTLVQAGRGPEAIAFASEALAAAPGDHERRFTLGLAQSEQDVDAAIATFRAVIAAQPDHALARYNLALALQRTDQFAAAIDELQRAIAIEPRPEALYALGVLHWHRGELGTAAAMLRRAVAAQPGYAAAQHTLGVVLEQQGDLRGAAAALRAAIALGPDLPGPYPVLARVLHKRGDLAAADQVRHQGALVRQRTEREREALALTAVGRSKFDRGDLTGALDDFRRAAQRVATFAPAHYQLGLVLRALGEPEAARAAFARAQQLNPALVEPPDRQ